MPRAVGVVVGVLFLAHVAAAQFIQQGSKLVGTGAVGAAHQGYSVAVSADGSTAVVTGYGDSSFTGAAWVFTRGEGVSSQEGEQVGRCGRYRSGQVRQIGGGLGGWEHGDRRRAIRQLQCRRRVGVHAQRGCVVAAREQARRRGCCR